MAGFRTHITVSTTAGLVYGGLVIKPLGYELETGLLAAALAQVQRALLD